MKRIPYLLIVAMLFLITFNACDKDDDIVREPVPVELDFSELEIEDFIWKGLNLFYFWKDQTPRLSDSHLDTAQKYYNLLTSESNPSDLFYSFLYEYPVEDQWSWIVEDYVALENSFNGVIESNGVKYKLYLECDGCNTIIGLVRYILPDSDADGKDVHRGYIFNAVNGTQLTRSNYQDLLGQSSYTLNFADYENGNYVSNGKSVDLVKEVDFSENPFHIVKTFDIDGMKIGYMMYNGFDGSKENEMKAAFNQLQAEGATELILDLRYNGGGYNYVTEEMASSITGQFKGNVLSKTEYNTEIQAIYEENFPEYLVDEFVDKTRFTGEALTSLNLSKLHVITTSSSASASELLISGLSAYIDVRVIGDRTRGKYVGSRTLYDSDNLSKTGDNLNSSHKYALQPIVFRYVNANGESVKGGIEPDHEIIEYSSQMKPLGEPDEPLLAEALAYVTGTSKPAISKKGFVRLKEVVGKLPLDQNDGKGLVKKINPEYVFKRK